MICRLTTTKNRIDSTNTLQPLRENRWKMWFFIPQLIDYGHNGVIHYTLMNYRLTFYLHCKCCLISYCLVGHNSGYVVCVCYSFFFLLVKLTSPKTKKKNLFYFKIFFFLNKILEIFVRWCNFNVNLYTLIEIVYILIFFFKSLYFFGLWIVIYFEIQFFSFKKKKKTFIE